MGAPGPDFGTWEASDFIQLFPQNMGALPRGRPLVLETWEATDPEPRKPGATLIPSIRIH